MIRKTLYVTAAAALGLAVWGGAYGASAAERPTQITPVVQSDDDGGRTDRDRRVEPGDDRRSPTATPSSTGTPSPKASAPSRSAEAGDDNGGRLDREQRVEPGDDRRVQGSASRGSDDRGTDDRGRGSDDRGSADRGRGSADRGSDDRGRGSAD